MHNSRNRLVLRLRLPGFSHGWIPLALPIQEPGPDAVARTMESGQSENLSFTSYQLDKLWRAARPLWTSVSR